MFNIFKKELTKDEVIETLTKINDKVQNNDYSTIMDDLMKIKETVDRVSDNDGDPVKMLYLHLYQVMLLNQIKTDDKSLKMGMCEFLMQEVEKVTKVNPEQFIEVIAEELRMMGVAFERKNNYESALRIHEKAWEIFASEEVDSLVLSARAINDVARCAGVLDDAETAATLYKELDELFSMYAGERNKASRDTFVFANAMSDYGKFHLFTLNDKWGAYKYLVKGYCTMLMIDDSGFAKEDVNYQQEYAYTKILLEKLEQELDTNIVVWSMETVIKHQKCSGEILARECGLWGKLQTHCLNQMINGKVVRYIADDYQGTDEKNFEVLMKDVEELRNSIHQEQERQKAERDAEAIELQNAIKQYKNDAEAGDAEAQYNLAIEVTKRLENNPDNAQEAISWLEKSAAQGFAPAICDLGAFYAKGIGVKRDMAKAVEYYTQSAELNFPTAQSILAGCYERGEGVEKNLEKALKLYNKAIEGGDVVAQFNLAMSYMEGDEMVKQDTEEGLKLYRTAVEGGSQKAMYNLANYYRLGEYIEKNMEIALDLLVKAADLGHVNSMGKLGEIYAMGEGVEQDYETALTWFTRAANYGDEYAIQNIKAITKILRENK